MNKRQAREIWKYARKWLGTERSEDFCGETDWTKAIYCAFSEELNIAYGQDICKYIGANIDRDASRFWHLLDQELALRIPYDGIRSDLLENE